jgi:hypothetical protein
MTVYGQIRRLRPLLVGFRRRSFRSFVSTLIAWWLILEADHALDSFLTIERTRFAFCTGVGKVFADSFLSIIGVETEDVLPCITGLAVNRVSIIIREVTDTLDCVWFFRSLDRSSAFILEGCDRRKEGSDLTRSRGLRRQEYWLVGHNLWYRQCRKSQRKFVSCLLSWSWEHDDAVQMARRGDRKKESRTRLTDRSLMRQSKVESYTGCQDSQSSRKGLESI